MPARFHQILLLVSLLWLSWLTMMLVHEGGHVLGAKLTGGRVRQVIWHPRVISRTDVKPNPHPLIEVWAGPVVGCLIPLLLASITVALRFRLRYLMWSIAGFCLIANGAYIGIGTVDPVGDAHQLDALGTPRWIMGAFGVIALACGFWIWHQVSPRFGFGKSKSPVAASHAYVMFALALLVTIAGLLLGNSEL